MESIYKSLDDDDKNNDKISIYTQQNSNQDNDKIILLRSILSKIKLLKEDKTKDEQINNCLLDYQTVLKSMDENFFKTHFDQNVDIITFFFNYLQEPFLNNNIKLRCIYIIDYCITYLKEPLIQMLGTNYLMTNLFDVLFKSIDQQDPDYLLFVYNITKILKTCCVYSTQFSQELYSSLFFKYSLDFLTLYSVKSVGEFPKPDQELILTSIVQIIEIYLTWCKLVEEITEEFIVEIIKECKLLVLLEDDGLDAKIFKNICQIYHLRPDIPVILLKTGFFELIYVTTLTKYQIVCGIDMLSTGLITESVQAGVFPIINLKDVLNLANSYLVEVKNSRIKSDDAKSKESILEALIALIANYVNYSVFLPENISLNEILSFVENVFANGNYMEKNCTAFLMLSLLSNNNLSDLDSLYPKEFIELFFDIISSGIKDVIEKSFEVFESFLNKSASLHFDINASYFLGSLVHDFFDNILTREEYFPRANVLLTKYYKND